MQINKTFYLNYVKIIYKWLKYMNNWYKMSIDDYSDYFENILIFLNDISQYIDLEKQHYIITLIYFKRILIYQNNFLKNMNFYNPFEIFVLSFIFCFKFWEETDYITHFIYKILDDMNIQLKYKCKYNSKKYIKYEFHIISTNMKFIIDDTTYNFYDKLIN